MAQYRLVERPAFEVLGKKTWISGQDNDLFGRFWEQCTHTGLFKQFEALGQSRPGPQTGGVTLGISQVEENLAIREFFYMIAIERPQGAPQSDLEVYQVPAALYPMAACLRIRTCHGARD